MSVEQVSEAIEASTGAGKPPEQAASIWRHVLAKSGWNDGRKSEILLSAWYATDPVYGRDYRVTIAIGQAALHMSRAEMLVVRDLIDKAEAQLYPKGDAGAE